MHQFSEVAIESVKEYWDRRPCNIRHSPKEVGTREYFDEVEKRKYFVEPHIPRLAEFDHWFGKKVLEIGCGIGTDTMNFARAGADVSAVDLSTESLCIAKRRAEVFGLADRITFFQADAERLPSVVPPEPYDLIYSFGVIHHTPHPELVMDHFAAYTKPGTTVKMMMYYKYSWKVLRILLTKGYGRFWELERFVAEHSEAQSGCPVTYIYSKAKLSRMLQAHGYNVSDVWVDHIFPYSIPEYVKYQYKKIWYFRWMPSWMFRAAERTFGWHLCITAVAKYSKATARVTARQADPVARGEVATSQASRLNQI